ncbi:hypothetical protein RLOC_00007922 [Lonchura striata]|uniref:Uncharacterized protein n=1 Tax=Lonchura striata TaxID=40157 RepID=A0A218UZT6_9PASE|nr:hypothetical protein RLOC_00007922 [Lonchura striata domestica]
MRPRCWLPVLPPPAAAAPAIPPSLPASRPSAPVASRSHPALPARGPFSLALPGRERSLTHSGWESADAGGSSVIPSPCTRGRRATLLRTHCAPGWPGVFGKADRLLLPCPTSWIGLCLCI